MSVPGVLDDEDRQALRAVTRRYLQDTVDHTNTSTVLAAAEFDRSRWSQMATQLGLQGTGISESAGGAGLGLPECLLVHEELGRALYPGPFLGTVGQVVPGLQAVRSQEAALELLGQIAAGRLTAAAALPPQTGAAILTCDDSGRVTGTLPCVVEAPLADGFLVAAAGPAGPRLLWAESAGPRVTVERLSAVDLTRQLGRVSFEGTAAQAIASGPAARQAIAEMRRGTMLALIAECVGVAGRALEMAVGYVASRHQFGRPIGSFQAIKHRCAELLIRLEAARSALALALSPARSAVEAEARLAAARICAGEAAFFIANENIHLHGGIGFTWEYPAHLYYRRAKSNQQLLDSAGGQRKHLAATVYALYAEQEGA